MVYYDAPHRFLDAEIDIALTIARQVGSSVERTRAAVNANRLAAIVEFSDDAIISKDLSGTIMSWNTGAERIFGYRAEEVIGKPITILMPADRINEEPRILARIRNGENVDHYETVRRHKNGRLIDISLTVSPIRDGSGRVVGASKISRDISERKRAEAKLKESQHQLEELLSAIPAAIYTTDADGKLTYFNEAAVELAGGGPTLAPTMVRHLEAVLVPTARRWRMSECPMAVALKEDRPIRGDEAIAERPDGTRIPFLPFPTPLHDAAGNLVGAVNMLVDIRAPQGRRNEAENAAERAVAPGEEQSPDALRPAQKSEREAKNEEARAVLAEAAARLSAMAAAHGALYHSDRGHSFDAAELVSAVCEAAEAVAAGAEIHCASDSVQLANDVASPVALILNELITNAAKYARNENGAAEIHVSLKTEGDDIVVTVCDNGPGFHYDPDTDKRGIGPRTGARACRPAAWRFHG